MKDEKTFNDGLLPDSAAMESMAREYAKLKKLNSVTAESLSASSPPPENAKDLLKKCLELEDLSLELLWTLSAALKSETAVTCAKRILNKKRAVIKSLNALLSSAFCTDHKPKPLKNIPATPKYSLQVCTAELLLTLDDLNLAWHSPTVTDALASELINSVVMSIL